jgi:hypothetical protein
MSVLENPAVKDTVREAPLSYAQVKNVHSKRHLFLVDIKIGAFWHNVVIEGIL